MFSILASSCVQGAWMFEMLAVQDMGASFWLVELFCDGGEETKKRLDSRSTRLRFERFNEPIVVHFVHRLVRRIMMQFLLKIFRSVLNLLSAELPDSRGIFVRLESQTVWLKNEKWWLNMYLISQAAWPAACTQYDHPADERDTAVQRLDTGHNTLLLPSGHFEMEKRWPIFCLISQAARRCTRPSAPRAQCVAASWWEGSQTFRRLDTSHFYCPFLVCCA